MVHGIRWPMAEFANCLAKHLSLADYKRTKIHVQLHLSFKPRSKKTSFPSKLSMKTPSSLTEQTTHNWIQLVFF
jgi:hypothetical protein